MIFRFIFELIVVVIIITVLRSVIGIVAKILGGRGPDRPAPGPKRPTMPTGGELKKDPVCGTFISTSGAVQKTVHGEVYYFCSPECRDKFKG